MKTRSDYMVAPGINQDSVRIIMGQNNYVDNGNPSHSFREPDRDTNPKAEQVARMPRLIQD